MRTLFLKEIRSFFSSLTGYISIIVFLVVTGLFMWLFPSTSVLDYGFASMETFFSMSPFILLFLIPAITMRSFAEETGTGTIEILYTQPLHDSTIIFSKYLAACMLVIMSVLPTLLWFLSIWILGAPPGNVDTGGVWGSYIGLLLLSFTFVSVGIFCSAASNNQIIAFILGVFLCFVLFSGFGLISEMGSFVGRFDDVIERIGMESHYQALSRGVMDSRDVVYFLTLSGIFITFTHLKLESRKW